MQWPGPPSLHEESIAEDSHRQKQLTQEKLEPLSQYYESTSSLDVSTQDEEELKLDASMSDSGLIGQFRADLTGFD